MRNTDKQLFLNIKNFSITDYKNDKRFLQLEIWGCCEGINRNESSFTVNSMTDSLPTLFNSPILCYIDKKKNDAKGHEMKLVGIDENGNPIYNFDNGERIVGIVNESSNVRIEEKDGVKWTVYTALIFVDYNYELRQILKRDKIKSVSIEIEVLESEMIGNIEQINKFIYKGTTILGRAIRPGIAGAMLKLLSFNKENFGQFKRQVAFALNESSNSQTKFTLPSSIKEIIQQQMDAIRNSPMNTTKQISTLITAKDLLINEDISLEQGELILQKIHEHENDLDDLNNQVLIMLLGGESMKEFVKSIGGQDKNFVSKNDYGTGDAIKISLTKAFASNDSWASVSKTKLRNNLLIASNYQSLVDKVYLVIDNGWEDAPSSSLHYPICEIKNNTLVYNVHGVQSARSFLEKNKDAPYFKSADTKLNKIYKKLGLDYDKNHIKYNEKEVIQLKEKFKELFAQENKYKFVGFNDKTVCVYSIEKSFEAIPYSVDSENHIIMDAEKAKEFSMLCKFVDDEDGDIDVECDKTMSETMSEMYSGLTKLTEEKTALMSEKEAVMSEKDVEIEKSKQLAEEKEEFSKEKDKAVEEKQMAEIEKEKAMSEKAEFEIQFSALKTENEKIIAEVNGFKEQKFAEIIKYCSNKYKMSEEDITIWTEKSKTFTQVEDFEKELVFTFHKASFKEDSHLKMGNLLDNKNKNKNQGKSAIQRLKEKQ